MPCDTAVLQGQTPEPIREQDRGLALVSTQDHDIKGGDAERGQPLPQRRFGHSHRRRVRQQHPPATRGQLESVQRAILPPSLDQVPRCPGAQGAGGRAAATRPRAGRRARRRLTRGTLRRRPADRLHRGAAGGRPEAQRTRTAGIRGVHSATVVGIPPPHPELSAPASVARSGGFIGP